MKKIRIGNDILIRWAITRNGEAEDFTVLSTMRVSVLDEIGARQKAEYSVSGNTITIQYSGANQKKNGVYSLLLEENRGIDGMVTLDHIEAFELVPHSAYAGGKTCSNIGIETVELSSDIDVAQGSVLEHPYKSLRRLGEYLYEMTFSTLPQYVQSNALPVGGCTSYVRDGKLYRNLDWKYDETPTFVIKTKEFDGIAFDNSVSDDNMRDNTLGQLPYRIVDGCNRHGIMGSVHVLFNDFDWHGEGSIPITNALYEVLTRVTSMETIDDELAPIIGELATTQALDAADYLLQVLITDGTTTYILTPTTEGYELVNITAVPKLTNFKWVGKRELERDDEDLQERPTGVDRWNFIECGADLEDLRFTKCYEARTRLSEFIGIDGTTKDSTDEELENIYERAHAAYLTRTRDGLLWQTMHSVVYGANGIEHLWTQENWDVDFVAQGGGGEFEQIQSDWNQNDDTQPDYIKNKPTIPDISGLATKTELIQGLSEKQNVIEDLDDIRQGAAAGATAVQPSALDDYRTSSAQDAIDEAIQGDIVAIENKIPSQATSANQLADKDFVNSSLNSITAFYVTKDAQGTQFATKAQLDSATTFYSGGEVRVPTRNDYCIVLADETKTDPVTGENPTTRYIYQNGWEFQYIVNKTTLTAAQLAAINSGITSGKVTQYDEYATSKQDTINDIETIRSGAALGATAYQKPSNGIPAADLAAGVIPDVSSKENISNKVSSFQNTPDNTHYPTEKLVKDSLNLKINEPSTEGTNGQVLTTDGNGGRAWRTPSASGTMYVHFEEQQITIEGETYDLYVSDKSFSEIISAIENNQTVVGLINSAVLQLFQYYNTQGAQVICFFTLDDTHILLLVCDEIEYEGQTLWDLSEEPIGLQGYDFAFLSLSANTTSFTFPANQRCYQKVSIAASATLNFAIENMADNYVRVYNSGGSEITLAIGTVTHNSTAVLTKAGPAEIKCGAGKYIEISVIYDGSDATFTASEDLQVLS